MIPCYSQLGEGGYYSANPVHSICMVARVTTPTPGKAVTTPRTPACIWARPASTHSVYRPHGPM